MRNSSILLGGGTITAIRPTLDSRPESIVLVLHSWNNGVDCTHGGVPDRKFGVSPSSSFFFFSPVSLFFLAARRLYGFPSNERHHASIYLMEIGSRCSIFSKYTHLPFGFFGVSLFFFLRPASHDEPIPHGIYRERQQQPTKWRRAEGSIRTQANRYREREREKKMREEGGSVTLSRSEIYAPMCQCFCPYYSLLFYTLLYSK